jgi:hypothetical protein
MRWQDKSQMSFYDSKVCATILKKITFNFNGIVLSQEEMAELQRQEAEKLGMIEKMEDLTDENNEQPSATPTAMPRGMSRQTTKKTSISTSLRPRHTGLQTKEEQLMASLTRMLMYFPPGGQDSSVGKGLGSQAGMYRVRSSSRPKKAFNMSE